MAMATERSEASADGSLAQYDESEKQFRQGDSPFVDLALRESLVALFAKPREGEFVFPGRGSGFI